MRPARARIRPREQTLGTVLGVKLRMTTVCLALALMMTAPKLLVSGGSLLALWPTGHRVFGPGDAPGGPLPRSGGVVVVDAAPRKPGEFFATYLEDGTWKLGSIGQDGSVKEVAKVPSGFTPDSLIGFMNGQLLIQDSRSGTAHSTDGTAWVKETSNRVPVMGTPVGPYLMTLVPDKDWKASGLSITVQARDGVAGVLYSMRPVRAWMVPPGEIPKEAAAVVGIAPGWSETAPVVFADGAGLAMVALFGEDGQLRRLVRLRSPVSAQGARSVAVLADGAVWAGLDDGRIQRQS